jgi:hypothetical protein
MAFDDFIKGLQPKKRNDTPEIVGKTLNMGVSMLDVDYLPMIMNNSELAELFKDEKQMTLSKRGWRFQFGSSRSWAGLCDPRPDSVLKSNNKNILVSIEFVKGDDNWQENCKDVIMHEIAHAIVDELFYFGSLTQSELIKLDPEHFSREGHGAIWEKVCVAINEEGKCSRFYENSKKNDMFMPYKYTCINCKHKSYGPTPTFAVKCGKCFKPVLIEGNI